MKKSKYVPRKRHLTPTQVANIVEAVRAGKSQVSLAVRNGVSQTTISNIVRGLVYGRLTGIEAIPRKRQAA